MTQYTITDINKAYFDKLNEVIDEYDIKHGTAYQHRATQSWEVYTDNNRLFQSYNTIVGMIKNGTFYEFGKYSATTSKQITTFCRDNGITNRVLVKLG